MQHLGSAGLLNLHNPQQDFWLLFFDAEDRTQDLLQAGHMPHHCAVPQAPEPVLVTWAVEYEGASQAQMQLLLMVLTF